MIDLAGTWWVTDEEREYRIEATFPGDIHSALIERGCIVDPYWGQAELEVQWVGRRRWIAEREFFVDNPARAPRWVLSIDVFDCVGEILVNGVCVARPTNMFVPVRVDVGTLLRPGENTIRAVFASAERVAAERAAGLSYAVPHTVYPVQSAHRNLVRKVQCHGGWDWGPALMTAGLYGTIEIEPADAWDVAAVWGIPRQVEGSAWLLDVTVDLDYASADAGRSEVPAIPAKLAQSTGARLYDPTGTVIAESTGAEVQPADPCSAFAERRSMHLELTVTEPALWWPAGYGAQPMYRVEVVCAGRTRTFNTAFRTVELVNQPDEYGRSMFLRINGRDVWAKGANWIPLDALPSQQTPERYRSLLEDARAANMNMLRVWGGGQYERDLFYALCDEFGIMVWQDFMFSCALYPSHGWFLDEVRCEVAAQMRRLTSRPCIVVWCGNNENVGALQWFPESRANRGRYLIDYDRLNTGVVAREVRAVDTTRVFWPSSPSAGEGDFADNWHDDSAGDMHYWSVWHEGKPFAAYHEVVPRFCSEFGFQSFPSRHGVARFARPGHFNPTAPDVEHHQRHPRGNTVITETMTRYFRVPFDFDDFLYLSQVQQAMAIQTAVDYWRSKRPQAMGALYWQLNDLWPVVSWSSIEYDGRWKLLHFAARRFFAPLYLVLYVHDTTLTLCMCNDTATDVEGTVQLRWLDWTGATRGSERFEARVGADSAVVVGQRPLNEAPFACHDGFAVAEWIPRAPNAAIPAERAWTFLCEPKRCTLQPPRIELAVEADSSALTVAAHDAPAFWVTLESDDPCAHFADNGLLILPGETRRIGVTYRVDTHARAASEKGVPDAKCREVRAERARRFTCRHLRSTYQ